MSGSAKETIYYKMPVPPTLWPVLCFAVRGNASDVLWKGLIGENPRNSREFEFARGRFPNKGDREVIGND